MDYKVLIIEDDPISTHMLANALENEYKKIYMAKDGQEGLKLFKEFSPQIIITDLHMPNMNGIELVKNT